MNEWLIKLPLFQFFALTFKLYAETLALSLFTVTGYWSMNGIFESVNQVLSPQQPKLICVKFWFLNQWHPFPVDNGINAIQKHFKKIRKYTETR